MGSAIPCFPTTCLSYGKQWCSKHVVAPALQICGKCVPNRGQRRKIQSTVSVVVYNESLSVFSFEWPGAVVPYIMCLRCSLLIFGQYRISCISIVCSVFHPLPFASSFIAPFINTHFPSVYSASEDCELSLHTFVF